LFYIFIQLYLVKRGDRTLTKMLETKFLRIQVTFREKQRIISLAKNKGFDTISDFVRDILLRNELDLNKLREIKNVLEVYSNGYDKRY